jgi:hypothetical protein
MRDALMVHPTIVARHADRRRVRRQWSAWSHHSSRPLRDESAPAAGSEDRYGTGERTLAHPSVRKWISFMDSSTDSDGEESPVARSENEPRHRLRTGDLGHARERSTTSGVRQ